MVRRKKIALHRLLKDLRKPDPSAKREVKEDVQFSNNYICLLRY